VGAHIGVKVTLDAVESMHERDYVSDCHDTDEGGAYRLYNPAVVRVV
jgi:hypothetical protein